MRSTSRVTLLVAALVAAFVVAPAASGAGPLTVVFLAGGQWDAALYQGPCGEVGLVDAGTGSQDEVLAQLDAWDARERLVWASVSHYDADHLGDVVDVGQATGVSLEAVYDRGGARDVKDSQTYRDYHDWVQPIRRPVDIGDRFTLCSGADTVTFTVTSAGSDGTAAGGVPVTEENDRGVCVKVEHGDFDLASCGDVNGSDDGSRTDVETAVAPAYGDVEVAKVNHHGARYSSNQTYVDTLSAEVAVVMAGRNSYGHPDPGVLARWEATGDVFVTLNGDGTVRDGDVTLTSAGAETFTVTTSASGVSRAYALDETAGTATPVARPADDSCPSGDVPEDGFGDADGTAHEPAIDCVVWWKVANGRTDTSYDPAGRVTRAQMASFVARLVTEGGGTLSEPTRDHFADDNGSPHEANINRLAEAGIVGGKGDGGYHPADPVTRDQMATFLVRASDHVTAADLSASRDWFGDDDGNTHEPAINKAAEAGFTGGTPSGGYNPSGVVSRGQMASFLARVLDLLVETGHATAPSQRPEPTIVINHVLADPDGDDLAYDMGEFVEVANVSDAPVSMSGWYLVDDAGTRLDWCAVEIPPDRVSRLYTGDGDASWGYDHCHAGRGSAVWNNDGDTARLYAPDGTLVDTHTY